MLKLLLTQATECKLNAIDWHKPFNVCTDASEFAVAVVKSKTDDMAMNSQSRFSVRNSMVHSTGGL